MKHINLLYVQLAMLFFSYHSLAQHFDDDFYRQNLFKTNYSIDSDADAVVLYEKADIHINPNGSGYNQVYHLHRIIKILKNKSQTLKFGDIKEVYPNDGSKDLFAKNIKGTTYNLEGNKIVSTSFDGEGFYDKKIDKHHHEMAFAMPAVKEGSIIEYEFEVITRLFIIMPQWEFQSKIPKLKSEFEVVSPNAFQYSSVRHGREPFKDYDNIKDAEKETAHAYHIITHVTSDRYSILWCRNNMSALKEEPFISSIENFRELLDLQIAGYNNEQYLSSWKEYNKELRENKYFGKQIDGENNFLNSLVDSITKKDDSQLKKAHSIFNYVRSNYDCSNFNDAYGDRQLFEVFANKRGTDAEINLLLTAMLKKAGINAAPVQISKLGHLRAIESYPFVNMFNYLVCLMKIDADQYYLDATDKFNRFGTLPVYCYNGYARVIDEEGYGITITSKNINDKDFFRFNVSRITDSSMNIEASERMGVINGIKLRNEIVKDSDFLRKHIDKRLQQLQLEATINHLSVDNLNDPEKDLVIKYLLRVKTPHAARLIYFNSDIVKFFQKNPFTATTRTLPMEFKNKCDYTYALDILLPPGMVAEELPLSSKTNVAGDGLSFEHNISFDSTSGMLSVISKFSVNETTFPVADYEHVKAFFEKMIQSQNSVLVLKRTGSK